MATKKLYKFPHAIIPSWFLMWLIVVVGSSVIVTDFLGNDTRHQLEAAKRVSINRQIEADRSSLSWDYSPEFKYAEANESDVMLRGAVALALHLVRFLLYCVLAASGGFLAISSILAIRVEVRDRVDRYRRQYKNQLTIVNSLPVSTLLLLHRPRFSDRFPNIGPRRSSAVVGSPDIVTKLALLLFCGTLVSGAFILSATQHFRDVEHEYIKTLLLRYETQRLIDELGSIRIRERPPRFSFSESVKIGLPDDTVNLVSYVPTGKILALILGFFAIVGSLIGVLRFVIGIKLGATRIANAPGARYLAVVDFLYSPRTVEETFKPIIADWRYEYFNALSEKRTIKARWISIRYYYRLAVVMGLSNAYAFIKVTVRR